MAMRRIFTSAALMLLVVGLASAEEGMWTLDNLPRELLLEEYDFSPTQEWLDHVRSASVRFMDGGSGAFVSPKGLIITNHHVAVGQLQKMSSEDKNYVEEGFCALYRDDEIKCIDLEIQVLDSMVNVTNQMFSASQPDMSEEEALKSRQAEQARIEKESAEKTGLYAEVVSLYRGGEYWLYRYRTYTDVRLVMAPEQQAAYFGGDSDNFTYPRYDLDVAFFRAYENGKPLDSNHYFRWNPAGASEGDLVFISGHPGGTSRLYSFARLEYMRDVHFPLRVNYIDRVLAALDSYARKGDEQERRAQVLQFGFSNSRKGVGGMWQALQDNRVMHSRKRAEEEFQAMVAANADWQKAYGTAWDRVEQVYRVNRQEVRKRVIQDYFGTPYSSRLINIAMTLVFHAQESGKPDAERLDGYHDSQLERLKFYLFSPAPIFRDLESELMQVAIEFARDELESDDPMVRSLAALGAPDEAARNLSETTQLVDAAFRQQLFEGGLQAIEESDDPLIQLAREMAPLLRETKAWQKEHVESVVAAANEQIAKARFAVYGKEVYPDANFTLRMTFGKVRGYPMNGTQAPYKTTLYGLFDRALGFDQAGEFRLPERYYVRQESLDLSTPVNFVAECDTAAGNSGSPVINTRAELVGIAFDGNIESLSGKFLFDRERNRSISVHPAYVVEALKKLYDADNLLREILEANESSESKTNAQRAATDRELPRGVYSLAPMND